MATPKLPASAEFFKQLSFEYQQLKFIVQVQENFVLGSLIHGRELETQYLLYIIEQLGVLILKTQQLKDKVEKQLYGVAD